MPKWIALSFAIAAVLSRAATAAADVEIESPPYYHRLDDRVGSNPGRALGMSLVPSLVGGLSGVAISLVGADRGSLKMGGAGAGMFLFSWTVFPSLGQFYTDNHTHAWVLLGVRSGLATASAVCMFLPMHLLNTSESEEQGEMVSGGEIGAGLMILGWFAIGVGLAHAVMALGIYDSIAAARRARLAREGKLARSWAITPVITSDRNGRNAGLALTARF